MGDEARPGARAANGSATQARVARRNSALRDPIGRDVHEWPMTARTPAQLADELGYSRAQVYATAGLRGMADGLADGLEFGGVASYGKRAAIRRKA